jgi:hypothetical protein
MERRYRGVMDIIRGAVFVVLARLRATEVVTLRCRRLSDMFDFPGLAGNRRLFRQRCLDLGKGWWRGSVHQDRAA